MEKIFARTSVRDIVQMRRMLDDASCGLRFMRQSGVLTRVWRGSSVGHCDDGLSLQKPFTQHRTTLSTMLRQRLPGLFCCSQWTIRKTPLVFDSFLRFRNSFDKAAVLYYSTQAKRQEQPGSKHSRECKGFGEQCVDDVEDDGVSAWVPSKDRGTPESLGKSLNNVREVARSGEKLETHDGCEKTDMNRAVVHESDDVKGDSGLSESLYNTSAAETEAPVTSKKPGLLKRFHETYKQYGKVLIGVHIFTSAIWGSVFYVAAMSGIDIEPALRWIGAGDTIMSFYTMPGLGNAAVAYLLYKLATPARYTVTIGGTHLAVKCLTHWGYMTPIPESNKLRSLVNDGKIKVKEKYEEYQDKMEDIRDELKELAAKERKRK